MARARKASYEELRGLWETVCREKDAQGIILQSYLFEEGSFGIKRGAYLAKVVGARRADGGAVGVIFDPGGQRASISCYFTEDWLTREMEWLKNLGLDKEDKLQQEYRELVYAVNEAYRKAQSAERDPLERS